MFWVILLVVVVVGVVVWKLRVPLLAKILGQDRVARSTASSTARRRARRQTAVSTRPSGPDASTGTPLTFVRLDAARATRVRSVDVFLGAHLLELLRGPVGALVDLAGERACAGG